MEQQGARDVRVEELLVMADEGNFVRFRTDAPMRLLRDSEVFLPSEFVACFPDDAGGPELHLRIEVRDGVPYCREAFLQSLPGGREVRQSDMKADLEHLLEVACQLASLAISRKLEGGGVMVVHSNAPGHLAAVAKGVSRARRNTRRKLADDRLPEVAEVYRANPVRPTAAVAGHFKIPLRTASLYVRRARDAGVLEETGHGEHR